MREAIGRVAGLAASWRGDLLLALVTLAWMVAAAAATARLGQHLVALVLLVSVAAALVLRRRWPGPAAVVAAAALLLAVPLGLTGLDDNWLALPVAWTAFLLCFALGTSARVTIGLAGVIVLAVSMQVAGGPGQFNPIVEMITLGSWLAGLLMRTRRTLTGQLEARNQELAAEQERFAQESVRYERARISRELHDIVAHCLSVMVVQASAGQRMKDADRDGMAEALMSVAVAAAQAQQEIGRLVELLRGDVPAGSSPNLQMIDELVRRAATTGLTVTCRFTGSCELAPTASETAYRLVQEALTNALKHAPGAPVTVTIAAQGAQNAHVAISVQNAAPAERPAALARSGGHYGLAAMRERVTACGGSLTAGPDGQGGWQVRALLPARTTCRSDQSAPADSARRGGDEPRPADDVSAACTGPFHRRHQLGEEESRRGKKLGSRP
jgi:signal transduction histidine kinase